MPYVLEGIFNATLPCECVCQSLRDGPCEIKSCLPPRVVMIVQSLDFQNKTCLTRFQATELSSVSPMYLLIPAFFGLLLCICCTFPNWLCCLNEYLGTCLRKPSRAIIEEPILAVVVCPCETGILDVGDPCAAKAEALTTGFLVK